MFQPETQYPTKGKNPARPSARDYETPESGGGEACRRRPVEAERADVEGKRAANALNKNPTGQRPLDETSDAVSGPRGPDRLIGTAPTGLTPDGRH